MLIQKAQRQDRGEQKVATPSKHHPYLQGLARPRILAHRGLGHERTRLTRLGLAGAGLDDRDPDSAVTGAAAEGIVENTEEAMRQALEAGADIIETDCRLTSDGHVVLIHDSSLRRILGNPGIVEEMTLSELRSLFAPVGGLLTVPEALQKFPTARFNIDCKTLAAAKPLGQAIAGNCQRVLVTSFADANRVTALAAATSATRAQQTPSQQTEQPTFRPATSPGKSRIVRIVLASLSHLPFITERLLRPYQCLQVPEKQGWIPVVTPRLLAQAHRVGVEVHVWTVNDAAEMRRLVAAGVDGIVTDDAALAVATLRPDAS